MSRSVFSDDDVPANQLVLRDAGGVEGIVVADAVEDGVRGVVGDADQERAAEARVVRAGGEQRPVGFELTEVGAMRILDLEDLLDRPAVAIFTSA